MSAFLQTGGIEKFNRCFIKALNEAGIEVSQSSIVSVYDTADDNRYNTELPFIGFEKRKLKSLIYVIREAFKADILIIGHINLAVAGWLVKLICPSCKVVVIAHGIEVWDRLKFVKRWCLRRADMIMAVSNYTKNQLVLRNDVDPKKISLFPNTIDPYFKIPQGFGKPAYLLDRYHISEGQPIILTLSRLSSKEQYKGYDSVIAALPSITKSHPNVIYILAGRCDDKEKLRVEQLIKLHGVERNVLMPGFIADDQVADHYQLADVFIMPSRKEGFGIVFLEALACGTGVIGGNQDGTVDALLNGSLGVLINPTKIKEIADAITRHLQNNPVNPQVVQSKVLNHYQFSRYKNRLIKYLADGQ